MPPAACAMLSGVRALTVDMAGHGAVTPSLQGFALT